MRLERKEGMGIEIRKVKGLLKRRKRRRLERRTGIKIVEKDRNRENRNMEYNGNGLIEKERKGIGEKKEKWIGKKDGKRLEISLD
jgi:hypothetical protein